MKTLFSRPTYDRDEYYATSARTIRWIVLGLVIITFPFTSPNAVTVFTIVALVACLNALHHIPAVNRRSIFASRINALAVDHVCVVGLIVLSGGLASPYYPLFFLLIIATIASFGIAGFAFSLSAQVIITLGLLVTSITPQPADPEFQFIIKLILLIIFSLVAEQLVRSRDEEYLLESRFTDRIENERQRLLALINSLSHAVLAVNAKGAVYLYNAAALELLNTNQDITNAMLPKLLPLYNATGDPVDAFKLAASQNRLINRQDLHYLASDGSKLTLDLIISPVHNFGGGMQATGGYMLVFRDITKEKSIDEERDEFISVTSHELRTPLAIAEANLSTALLPKFGTISARPRALILQAHANILFLSEIIHDLTTLSRAERADAKVTNDLVDIPKLLESLRSDYASSAQSKHLEFEIEIAAGVSSIYSSEHELREILQNFITNAIKYTPSGKIKLAARSDPSGTTLSVSDTGIGVSATDKPKIFGKFYRSEDYRTRQTGGTGLGLYITRKLADKLGVKISFASKLNHGSTFSLVIPPVKSSLS